MRFLVGSGHDSSKKAVHRERFYKTGFEEILLVKEGLQAIRLDLFSGQLAKITIFRKKMPDNRLIFFSAGGG